MITGKVNIKPLSINKAFQGKRFKTSECKVYEKDVMFQLKAKTIGKKEMLRVDLFFGFSNIASDLDNPCKLLIDIFQKKYGFNDSQVFELNVRKCKVGKGKEFIEFGIFKLLPF
jgi:Holliday junction resolvase RusA-like endonuclease